MDLTQILLNCHNPIESVRNLAEQQLCTAQKNNLGEYLTLLAEELHNETKPELSRQLAGLLLKNSISGIELRLDIEKRNLWMNLPIDIKGKIKTLVLESILSPVNVVRGSVCQVIAKLGRVEIPCNGWPELLPSLLKLTETQDTNTNTNQGIIILQKRSAYMALGYLCEDSKQLENEISTVVLSVEMCNQILSAVIRGMNDRDPETILVSTKAFSYALYFARNSFKSDSERNLIFHILCGLCTSDNNEHIQIAAYECLVIIANEYYEYLGQFLSVITPIIIKGIKEVNEPVSICCIEFWNTIADLELDLLYDDQENKNDPPTCLNYISQVQTILVPVILEALLRQNDDDTDFESWTVAKAAGACLTLCSQLLCDSILDPALAFIQSNFSHSNWHNREAAVLAYGSIMEGPSLDKMKPIVETSVTNLCHALNDNIVAVRDTCAWTIGRIITFYPSTVFPLLGNPPVQYNSTLSLQVQLQQNPNQGLMSILLQKLLIDEPRVCSNICWTLHQLSESSSSVQNGDFLVNQWFIYVLQSLLEASRRQISDENNMKQACYNAISMIILHTGEENINYLVDLLQGLLYNQDFGLKALIEGYQVPRPEHVIVNIQLLVSLFYTLTTKLQGKISQFSNQLLKFYYLLLCNNSACSEEVFMALTSLIVVLGMDFTQYSQECVKIVLVYIQNYQEVETCKLAVELIGDLVRAIGQNINPFLETIVQTLYTLLAKNDVDRKIKSLVIITLGDLAMNLNTTYIPYIQATIQFLQQASITNYTDGPISNDDWIDYLGDLRNSVLQSYTSIIYGIKDAHKLDILGPYVINIISFINNIVNDYKGDYPNDSNLKNATALLGDLLNTFSNQLVQYLMSQENRPILENICSVGSSSKSDDVENNIKWIKKLCHLTVY